MMNSDFEEYLNIRTESEMNGGPKKVIIRNGKKKYKSEHWTERNKRHQEQKKLVKWLLTYKRPLNQTPLTITLTRVAPRFMDYTNLVSSFKYIEDACAEYFHPGLAPGRADGFGDILFVHKQIKGKPKEYKIKIEFKYGIC